MKKIVFVCLGNICRSPIAEGILKAKIAGKNLNWEIESKGTEAYHIGKPADARGVRTAANFGVNTSQHIARQFTKNDFKKYEIIYAMSTDVYEELRAMAKDSASLDKLKLFMDIKYPGKNLSVPDPWYGSEEGYIPVFEMIDDVCNFLVEKNTF